MNGSHGAIFGEWADYYEGQVDIAYKMWRIDQDLLAENTTQF